MMPRIPLLLVLVLLLAFLLTCTVESAVITHYTVEMVTTSNSSGSSWATYDETVCSSGSTIKVSGSGYAFNALKFSSDFYQLPLTPWFASQFGFLSPMASGLCTGFCEDKTLSTFNGFYSFSSNPNDLRDGGGDWPMIGLFVYNMMLPTSGKVCSLASSADSVTVEYSGLVAVGASASAKPLKAQVTLSQSGTIVFRYQSLPKLASAKDQIPPSVGLILTKNQRVVVEAPTESNGIVAYRFTPQLDTCPATKEQGSCLSSADCGWCSATSSCISIITQQDRCPRTQFVTSTPETPTPGYQKFYNVKMDYSGRLVETQNQWLTIQSLANVNEVEFLLLQPFPYFMGANSVGSNLNIYGTNPSVLALNSASFNCNPIKNVCPNGNYSMSLLMGQSSMTWARAHAIQYTYQFSNGVTCESASQGDDCLDFVMQVLGVVPINFITILAPPQVFAYQVALNPDGSVDMVFEVSAPTQPLVWTYPPLMMGLMRNGISDPSSVVIPPAMIQNGLHLRFTPVSACPNCGAHGYCDNATGTCECAIGFNGPTCDLCAPGFYGRTCLPCPSCVNGGTCDAGMGGSGTCTCPVGFTGPTCLQKCTKVHGDGTCSKCKSPGGRCLCGLCVCNDGYTGSSCSKVSYDPCMRYTFDGCPICGSHPGCAFCFSNVCYSPSLSGTSRGYSCSYSATKEESNICVITPMPATSQSEAVSIFIVVLLSSASFVCFSLVVLIAVLTYRRRVVLNRMVEYAGTATLDDAVFKKRRTVVQHFVVPPAVILPDQFVMAVPLKQISLRKLAVLQLEEEKHVSGNQERSVHDHT